MWMWIIFSLILWSAIALLCVLALCYSARVHNDAAEQLKRERRP